MSAGEQCWFCNKRPSVSIATYDVVMHGSPNYIGHQVAMWGEGRVKVARCATCMGRHRLVRITAWVGACVFAGVSLMAIASSADPPSWWLTPIGVVMIGVLGHAVVRLAAERVPSGTLRESAIKEHPMVQKWLRDGWRIGPAPRPDIR